MKNDKLYALINDEGLYSDNLLGTAVTGKDKNYLRDIKNLLDVFAVNGEDNRRGLWIEFPWDQKEDYANRWIFISVSCYNGHIYLSISDNDFISFVVHDDSSNPGRKRKSRKVLLGALKEYLEEKIPEIAADVDAYNKYVEQNLPKRQRIGHISSKYLNSIVPWHRKMPSTPERCIQVLKECMANELEYRKQHSASASESLPSSYRPPYREMNIDLYAKYFRIAQDAHDQHFKSFYKDYYEEGVQYDMRLLATDCFTPGEWIFSIEIHDPSRMALFMDVAVALYDSGCPLLIRNAKKLLDILEEKDEVILAVDPDDNCIRHNETDYFTLPDETFLGWPSELSREQYDQIVTLARWDKEIQVALAT